MPREKANRVPAGAGSVRPRKDAEGNVVRWEGRVTVGRDLGTGKQLRRSVYGATQAEVVKAMQKLQVSLEDGTYSEPSKLTLSEWLDIWYKEYTVNVKESTREAYSGYIRNHIKPALGAVNIQKLRPEMIQGFYNNLLTSGKSPKTVRNVHGVLHSALKKAVKLKYLVLNPAEEPTLPRIIRKEMLFMDDDKVLAFLEAIDGHRFEAFYFVSLFTGMRQAEVLGLSWPNVDFSSGAITISQQLVKEKKRGGTFYLDSTKNDKVRTIRPAKIVMDKLRERKRQQTEHQLMAGAAWSNPWGLVFTDELGGHLVHVTVYKQYKAIVAGLGVADLRFHDMRHSYAVMSFMNGDDPLTVQRNLGHHTAAFTMDVYGHISTKMQEESAARMDAYIKGIKNKNKA